MARPAKLALNPCGSPYRQSTWGYNSALKTPSEGTTFLPRENNLLRGTHLSYVSSYWHPFWGGHSTTRPQSGHSSFEPPSVDTPLIRTSIPHSSPSIFLTHMTSLALNTKHVVSRDSIYHARTPPSPTFPRYYTHTYPTEISPGNFSFNTDSRTSALQYFKTCTSYEV